MMTEKDGSGFCTMFSWAILLWATDLIAYGWLVPVMVAYAGGRASAWINLHFGTVGETLIVMSLVFWTLSILFRGRQEAKFWRHYFSGENGFQTILRLRDAVNCVTLVFFVYRLVGVMLEIIADGGIKEKNLHEGVFLVALKPFASEPFIEKLLGSWSCKVNNFGHSAPEENPMGVWESFWMTMSNAFWTLFGYSPETLSCREISQSKSLHGAEFLLVMAQLTASVTKLIYFNSLYAYMRAMNIFIKMENDGELSNYMSTCLASINEEYEDERSHSQSLAREQWEYHGPKSAKSKEIYTTKKAADHFKR